MLVRAAGPDDEAGWRTLWAGYQAHYGLTLPETVTIHTWARVQAPDNPLGLRLACADAKILGFALFHLHESTWVTGQDCYLEDLFVTPDARGRGAATMLMDDLIALGRLEGWRRLHWQVEQNNAPARRLYDRYTSADGHIRYRMPLNDQPMS